jgi:hypothetical protein
MFQNVFQHIKKYFNKRNILFILLVSVFVFSFYDISFAGVSEWTMAERESRWLDATTGAPAKVASEAMRWVWSVLALLTSLVTLFMHPGWYTGEIFDINVYLKEIWILVSNVVYFVFAILLVWVALMNIIWKWGDYELKKQLPKFIVGILIVPFSWFIVQFLVSLAAVLTAAVLSLPYDTFKSYESMAKFQTEMKIPAKCEINLWGSISSSSSSWGWSKQAWSVKWIDCEKWGTITMQELFDGTWGGKKPWEKSVFGIMQIYTYGILDFQNIDKVSLENITSLSWIKNLTNLSLKAIMNLFFVVVYLILLFALFLALFVRWIQIWVYMMISPLFWLFYYFWGSIGKLGKLSDFNLKNFIWLAMMPVYVAAALSFWLLFIAVVNNGMTKSAGSSTMLKCTWSSQDQTCSITLGWFELAIKGAMGKSWEGATDNNSNPVGYLIMQMFAIVVLWVSVMAALNTSDLTKSVIKPFEEFGSHVWWVVQKLPQYTPIPFTGGFSPSQLKNVAADISNTIERASDKDRIEKMKGNPFLRQFVSENAELYSKLRADMNSNKNDTGTITSNTNSILSTHKEFKDVLNAPDAKAYLERYGEVKITNEKDIVAAIKNIWQKTSNATWRDISPTWKYEDLVWNSNTSNPQQQSSNVNVEISWDTHKINLWWISMSFKKWEKTEAEIRSAILANSTLKPKVEEIIIKLKETTGFFK